MSALLGVCAVDDDDGNKASEQALTGKPAIKPPQKSDAIVKEAEKVFDGKEVVVEMANDKQRKLFYAIAKGKNMSNEDMKAYLMNGWGIESSWKIPSSLVNEIIADLKGETTPPHQPQPQQEDGDVPF